MINGIFFDLFGTLLKYGDMPKAWDNWLVTTHELLVAHGLNVTKKKLALHCDQFFSKDAPASEQDGMTVYEYRINRLCKSLNICLDKSYLNKIANLTANAWQKEITLAPDCKETLKILRKTKRLVIITNFDHPPHVNSILSQFEIKHYFEEIVISADVGYKKPNPEIFRIALKRTSLTAAEVVYVGDTKDDINGALDSRIKPILINNSFNQNQLAYDYHHKKPLDNNTSTDDNPNIITISKLSNLTKIFK